jgi:hypothetical protein
MSETHGALKDLSSENGEEDKDRSKKKSHPPKRAEGKEEKKLILVTSVINSDVRPERRTGLRNIHGEIMDKIFCVRPELGVSSRIHVCERSINADGAL